MGVCARRGGQQKETSSAPFYHNCNYHIPFLKKKINDAALAICHHTHCAPLSHTHTDINSLFSDLQDVGVFANHNGIRKTDLPINSGIQWDDTESNLALSAAIIPKPASVYLGNNGCVSDWLVPNLPWQHAT